MSSPTEWRGVQCSNFDFRGRWYGPRCCPFTTAPGAFHCRVCRVNDANKRPWFPRDTQLSALFAFPAVRSCTLLPGTQMWRIVCVVCFKMLKKLRRILVSDFEVARVFVFWTRGTCVALGHIDVMRYDCALHKPIGILEWRLGDSRPMPWESCCVWPPSTGWGHGGCTSGGGNREGWVISHNWNSGLTPGKDHLILGFTIKHLGSWTKRGEDWSIFSPHHSFTQPILTVFLRETKLFPCNP